MKQNTIIALIILFSLILIISSCEMETPVMPPRDNPNDPGNPNYQDPFAEIKSGPLDGSTISTNSVTFTWQGRLPASSFSYKLVGFDADWSNYNTITSVSYDYLDEEQYIFQVKEKYINGDPQDTSTARSFTVNAISGPAFVMNKQLNTVVTGNFFTIEVMAEEVTDLMGVYIKIIFTPGMIYISDIEEGTFLNSNAPDGTAFITGSTGLANALGWLEINASRLGGNPPGASGSGALARITFQAVEPGASYVNFSPGGACQMRDSDNNAINFNSLVSSRVEIN
ncbi:hypothetical protein ISS30_08710 [bacterium]|nr:hypothetical protein [bacterium]